MSDEPSRKKSAIIYEFFRRRRLPHIETCGRCVYLTFATKSRWILPLAARSLVMDAIVYEHNRRLSLVTAIVMPDHVHMLYHGRRDEEDHLYTVAEIAQAIKSVSAHRINKSLGRRGSVWEEEYFDRIVRSSESLEQKIMYIGMNSVRAGLCESPEEYPFLWLCWTDDPEMQDKD